MKKIGLLLLLAFTFLSCEKNYHEYYIDSYYKNYTVRQGQWELYDRGMAGDQNSIGTYFYCEIPDRDITINGVKTAYMLYNVDGIGQVSSPLPLEDYFEAGNDRWAEQVTCEFSSGMVTFIVKYSDFSVDVQPPGYNFRIMFIN